MDSGLWIVLGLIVLSFFLVLFAANETEKRWNRMHPPNGYDGMREDEEHDEDSRS